MGFATYRPWRVQLRDRHGKRHTESYVSENHARQVAKRAPRRGFEVVKVYRLPTAGE